MYELVAVDLVFDCLKCVLYFGYPVNLRAFCSVCNDIHGLCV